jgi:hypothetical protein
MKGKIIRSGKELSWLLKNLDAIEAGDIFLADKTNYILLTNVLRKCSPRRITFKGVCNGRDIVAKVFHTGFFSCYENSMQAIKIVQSIVFIPELIFHFKSMDSFFCCQVFQYIESKPDTLLTKECPRVSSHYYKLQPIIESILILFNHGYVKDVAYSNFIFSDKFFLIDFDTLKRIKRRGFWSSIYVFKAKTYGFQSSDKRRYMKIVYLHIMRNLKRDSSGWSFRLFLVSVYFFGKWRWLKKKFGMLCDSGLTWVMAKFLF